MAFAPEVIAAFASGNIGKRIFYIQFNFDSGIERFTTAPADKVFNGNTFESLGALGSVGQVKETDEIEPADYEVILGGVDTVILSKFLGEPTINRKCTVYQALMNDDQTIIGGSDAGPWIYFDGLMQPPFITDGEEPALQVPVKDILADWDRNITSRYTDAEQRRLYPDDYCFEFVSSLAGKEIVWPTAKWFEDNQ